MHSYQLSGSSWLTGPEIHADEPMNGAMFGRAVALTEGGALIGAPFVTNMLGERPGAIYFYDLPWTAAASVPRGAAREAVLSP